MRRNFCTFTLALAVSLCASMTHTTAQTISPNSTNNRVYGKLPIIFEANQGQTNLQVKFVSRGPGYTAFLTGDGMVLSLRPAQAATTAPMAGTAATGTSRQTSATTLEFRLVGATKNPVVVGEKPQPGRANYFIGNNPAKWHRNVPTYGQIRYKNVYPGIDLIYYGNQQQMEYDFAVAPGADASRIQFEVKGANSIGTDENGNLLLQTKNGNLRFQLPAIYQESSGQRSPVAGSYNLMDATHFGFQLNKYDSSKPVVIDPVLLYSTYLGGSGTEQPYGIAVDSTGSTYITGYTDSVDFPLANLGSLPAGNDHVFVAKLDPTGSTLVYADYLGGSGYDYGYGLALDSSNNVYVTGSTESSDFPVVNALMGTEPGFYSGFVTKISADGSSVLYSTYLGGNSWDQPSAIAVDGLGQIYVAGSTASTNFPTANAYQSSMSANQGGVYGYYGFVSKITADGSSFVYSTYFGGNSNVQQNCGSPCWPQPYNAVMGLAIDASGNAYVDGNTNTYNFPTTQGSYLATNTTPQDATIGFVSKFTSSGSLGYSTYFYESSGNQTNLTAIAVDGNGSAYVTGGAPSDGTFPITSTSICDPSVYATGCGPAFVTKFDPTASTLLYSTFLGPYNNASPQSIAVDANNNAYVLSSASSTWQGQFGIVNGIQPYSNGNDLLLVEIDAAASSELFATYFGGSTDEFASGLAIDGSGNMYVSGSTDSTDLPITTGAFQSVLGGNTDALIAKISPSQAASVLLSQTSLQFSALAVGTTSTAQSVVLRNMGSAALTLKITTTGDFAESDNCGTTVAGAGSCTLSVTFTPTAAGARSGSVSLQDDAASSPQVISLSGIGNGPSATLSVSSLNFGASSLQVSTPAQSVTLSNTGNAALNISGISISGAFQQTNNCPSALQPSSSCVANVTFKPTTLGTSTGTLTFSTNAGGTPETVTLTGTGPDFALTANAPNATVTAGSKATYTIKVASVGASFTNAVTLACTGAPANSTCSVSPSSVTPGSTPQTVTVKVSTNATVADATPNTSNPNHMFYAMWTQFQVFGLLGIVVGGSKRRSRTIRAVALMLILIGAMAFVGCAGGTGIGPQSPNPNPSSPGTASGTYTLVITGTSGSVQHSVNLTLTVQ